MIRTAAPLLLLLATACLVPGRHGRPMLVAPIPVPMVSLRFVDREPPPIRREHIPQPPSIDHVWMSGYWSWDGRAHVWVPGRHHVRPRARAAWVDGHWARHERGWHWIEGHWR